ncbi:MAG: DNA-processing protein DprA, partial [Catalinimonas sp.]
PLFPARNRIIAGLSDVVVVVESAVRGGGLITARMANDYHREAMAVPGPVDAEYSAGCHQLIARNEAALYTGVESLAQLLGWDQSATAAPTDALQTSLFTEQQFTPDEWRVMEVLRTRRSVQIDELSYTTRIGLSALSALLLQLEFRGVVQALPGKNYALRDASR